MHVYTLHQRWNQVHFPAVLHRLPPRSEDDGAAPLRLSTLKAIIHAGFAVLRFAFGKDVKNVRPTRIQCLQEATRRRKGSRTLTLGFVTCTRVPLGAFAPLEHAPIIGPASADVACPQATGNPRRHQPLWHHYWAARAPHGAPASAAAVVLFRGAARIVYPHGLAPNPSYSRTAGWVFDVISHPDVM